LNYGLTIEIVRVYHIPIPFWVAEVALLALVVIPFIIAAIGIWKAERKIL